MKSVLFLCIFARIFHAYYICCICHLCNPLLRIPFETNGEILERFVFLSCYDCSVIYAYSCVWSGGFTFVSYMLVSRILDLALEGYNILRTLGYIALRFLGVIVPQ